MINISMFVANAFLRKSSLVGFSSHPVTITEEQNEKLYVSVFDKCCAARSITESKTIAVDLSSITVSLTTEEAEFLSFYIDEYKR
ncbi:7-cyano-7-deazaguanine synthase [Pectobacterium phage POP12]|nr:7-cyano-7-deazaguanine synthase [Pectobacterium phage POP12]